MKSISDILNQKIEFSILKKKFSRSDKISLFDFLLKLQSAGVPLIEAITTYAQMLPRAKSAYLKRWISKLIQGKEFHHIVEESGLLDPSELLVLSTMEKSGNFKKVYSNLIEYNRVQKELRQTIAKALSYPVIVLIVGILVVVFLTNFLVPMFSSVYAQMGQELPKITQLVLLFSSSIPKILIFLVIIAILVGVMIKSLGKSEVLSARIQKLVLTAPLIGKSLKDIWLLQLFGSFDILISSGISLSNSLDILSQHFPRAVYRASCKRMLQGLLQGGLLSEVMEEEKLFLPEQILLIGIGEQSGQLVMSIRSITDGLKDQAKEKAQQLATFLEPIIILFIGLIVGVVLVAMYLPIFQMGSGMDI